MDKKKRNIIIIVAAVVAAIGIVLAIVLPIALRNEKKFYTVTFDSNGGTEVASVTDVPHGSTIKEPAAPTRNAYTFDGWYSDSDLKTKWVFEKDKVTSDITLYAKWNYNATNGLEYRKDGNSYTLTGIGEAKNVENVILPELINDLPVTAIANGAFKGEKTMKSVYVPASITTIGESAFNGCEGLATATFAGSDATLGFRIFYACSALEKVTLPSAITEIAAESFYTCGKLKDIVLPTTVTAIGDRAFYECESLTKFSFNEGLTKIGEQAFSLCKKIAEVKLPASLRDFGAQAFSGCSSITTLTVERANTAFYSEGNCLVAISPQDNTLVAGCSTSVIPGNGSAKPVTKIGYGAFQGQSALTRIAIPSSVTIIDDYAFTGCRGLTRIVIPTSVKSIGDHAFASCEYVEAVIFGSLNASEEQSESGLERIGKYAFSFCDNMERFVIPKSIKFIGFGAFYRDTPNKMIVSYAGIRSDWDAANDGNHVTIGQRDGETYPLPDSVVEILGSDELYVANVTGIA